MSFAYLILGLTDLCRISFNVDTLSVGFGHRNCVVIGCPNSGQRVGKWAATTCELHGCNSVVTMAQACVTVSAPSNDSHSRQKRRTRNADYNGQII